MIVDWLVFERAVVQQWAGQLKARQQVTVKIARACALPRLK
jgi:hypothetical protein